MIINALLHLHASDDPKDYISYSFETALKEAQKQGINAVALTCHNAFVSKDTYQKIADKYGILFISGVEKVIEKRDVIVLNADESIQNVHTFEALRVYKQIHPNCFIIAPHPYFPGGYSLKKKLEEYKDCFDAIELSWFHSKHFNYNKKAQLFAEQHSLPYIATPDAHNIKYLCSGYVSVDSFEFSEVALFDAIKKQKYKNIYKPTPFLKLITYWILFQFTQIGKNKKSRKNMQ